jgi:hypothetical protein
MGLDNFYDMIADETVGITEEEILPLPPGERPSGPVHGSADRITAKSTGRALLPAPVTLDEPIPRSIGSGELPIQTRRIVWH